MKKLLSIIIFISIMVTYNFNCLACTCFSVKSQNVYYGKNWDFYPDRDDVTFYMIDVDENITRLDVRLSGGYLCTSVNNKGFFVTTNYNTNIKDPGDIENKIILRDLHEEIVGWATKVSEIIEMLKGKMILSIGFPEHVFCSDIEGNACILETDNEKSYVISNEEKFSVMTNFPVYSIDLHDDISKITCSRYKTAYQYIKNNISSFDMEDGIEVLKRTAQNGSVLTKYSLLGVPEENTVYLFLNRNYDKIWEISFTDKSISTYSGFEDKIEFKFDSGGIKYIDLVDYQETDKIKTENINEEKQDDKTKINDVDNTDEEEKEKETSININNDLNEKNDMISSDNSSQELKSTKWYLFIPIGIVLMGILLLIIIKYRGVKKKAK